MQQREAQVLISGAGPTGLFLAYALTRQGIGVRLIDKRDGPEQESRAMGVQARTLEFYRAFGLADEAVALGIPIETGHVFVLGREAARLSLGHMGQGLSPYPFLLALAQDVHEKLLLAKLDELGVSPEWRTELLDLSQDDDAVHTQIRNAAGAIETARFSYLAGCDGAHSATRAALNLGFAGGQSEGLAFVADVAIDRPNTDFNLAFGDDRLGLLIPVRTSGMQRLIGLAPPRLAHRTDLRFEEVGPQLAQMFDVTVREVNWFSVYHVHHRVAERFHVGRCFLAGDAGHIHSPVGGQGMNTGLGDAMNLSWKLAAVLNGASPALLDSYDAERRAFAKTLIATTDAAFQALTAPGWFARQIRLRVAPRIVNLLSKFEATGRLLFRAISQTRIAYRQSALSEGAAGGVRGGDRLPWLAQAGNYAALDGVHWRLQIYGHARPDLCAAAKSHGIETSIFEVDAATAAAGYAPEAAYLIRPDSYVGLALPDQSVVRFEAYVARHLPGGGAQTS
jgi:2-polyprenyl-6-methoxyphenol hydroxylase-like FAD-dependent oxidoreductase